MWIYNVYAQSTVNIPVTIDVVVEHRLIVLLNVPVNEESRSDVAPDSSLSNIAVWITAVIHESSHTAGLSRIDKLVGRP